MKALSAEIIGKIRKLRNMRKLPAQDLAARMTAAGFPVTRAVLANYESGRKDAVTLDFADAAARALGTDLATLLTQPVECPTCHDEPPTDFTCNTCGRSS